jgi:hypothetical protein
MSLYSSNRFAFLRAFSHSIMFISHDISPGHTKSGVSMIMSLLFSSDETLPKDGGDEGTECVSEEPLELDSDDRYGDAGTVDLFLFLFIQKSVHKFPKQS